MTAPRTTTRSGSRHLRAQLSGPVRRFIATEAASAALLVLATGIALLWANSPFGDTYDRFWRTEFSVRLGGNGVTESLQHWVNEGLMVFFFLVGMEVRRELQMGELTQRSRLSVPTLAAFAGLVVPALVYTAFNAGGPGAHGWGIPMATDTAFLLGVLALAAPHAPTQLRVFLLSLSVVDDIGALTAIAVFYSDSVDVVALAIAALCVLAFFVLTRLQVWRGPFYFAVGTALWLAMSASGVSPTIGGVVLGLLVSAYPPRREAVESAGVLARAFRQSPEPALARQAKLSVERAISPNERIGALLVPWSGYVVVPVFALANAGVQLSGDLLSRALTSPVTLGVYVALVAGKFLGVGAAATAAVRSGLGQLPPGVGLRSVWGGAVLAGLGFTVSLFVTDLAFPDEALRDEARVGILAAAVTAAVLGTAWFRWVDRRTAPQATTTHRLDPPVDPARDHVRGPVDAPLELVEYGGLECPFCGRATGVVEELRRRFGDDLRYVFRHLPLPEVHPHGELAAEATEAAAAQGAFWAMHDRLFAHQDQLEPEQLVEHAAAVGLDLYLFTRALGEGRFAQRVRDDVAAAEASGVRGTPTFFVNGIRHEGPAVTEALAAALLATDPRGPSRRALPPDPDPAGPARARTYSPVVALPAVEGALAETPPDGASPRLTPAQVAAFRRVGRRVPMVKGQVLLRAGGPDFDFFVVEEGLVAIVEGPLDGLAEGRRPRVVAVYGPGRFFGGLNMLAGQRPVRSLVAASSGEVLAVSLERLRSLLARDRQLGDLVNRSFLLRRALLIGQARGLRVVGDRRWPASIELKHLLQDAGLDYQWLDPAEDAAAARVWQEIGDPVGRRPVALAPDGRLLVDATREELVRASRVVTDEPTA